MFIFYEHIVLVNKPPCKEKMTPDEAYGMMLPAANLAA